MNLKKAVESTTSYYCSDFSRDFDDFLLHRMGDAPSVKNRQNLSKNQHISNSSYDSTAFFRLKLIVIGILLSFNATAGDYFPKQTSQDQPWSVTASAGSGNYHLPSKDKNAPIGRLALANEMMLAGNIALGLELGLQTGTRIKLDMPQETFQALKKWIPVQTTLAPTLDLLVTTKSDPLGNSSFFAQLKGGLAYRHWRDNRVPLNDISQLAGEIQAGFGYPITALANLNLLYQGIFSGNGPNLHIDTYSKREELSNIPTLHAILLGLSVNL